MKTRIHGFLAGGVLAAIAGGANAQVEILDFDRPESWAMKRSASLLLFTSMGPPTDREDGDLEFSVEGIWNPSLSLSERKVGFKGTKVENVNRLPVVPRPRLTMGIGFNTTFELAYIPPVEIEGITPNVLAVALERPMWRCDDFALGLRVYGQLGTAEGDITCSEDDARADADIILKPRETRCLAPSADEVQLNYAGIALTGGYALPENLGGSLFFGAYATYLDLEFQVDAMTETKLPFGDVTVTEHDMTKQLADGWLYSFTAGYSRPIGDDCRLAVEAYYSPLEVMRNLPNDDESSENDSLFNLRAMVTYRF